MNKKEFVTAYAGKIGETKKKSEELINDFLDLVEASLVEGKEVQFIGWGTFYVKEMPERNGVNPATGAKIKIGAKKVVKFKTGKKLAEVVK
ncbi:HU family DNA-binding protein [Sneathia vaginalis]|jgi:hypothetical protein|uniref:DNA-binding protein n=1 Tax=Sneathia vaginalis TaxID=187101 RepID=A0A0E3ZD79_9FUSO|nr:MULTISPECIES: HU family DNA-binding protein [Sneathia]AKC96046.1 DNA-binding protein [Sneathia vaginalis]MBE2990362.1 HU family DNA-binding protein [Sneathia sp. DSM 16630]MBE3031089.1 HU family DNA-binding protein [Sneathia sp. DSM 16631]MDK9581714.1 HU family DNA-binding protein [Sneathia vaginalis]